MLVIVFSSLRLLQQTSPRKPKKSRSKSKKTAATRKFPCGCCLFQLIGIDNIYLLNAIMHPYYIRYMQIDIYSEMHNDPLDALQSINLLIAV